MGTNFTQRNPELDLRSEKIWHGAVDVCL